MEIVQGVHQIKVPLPGALDHMNIYLIEGTKGNLLIDTGFDTPEAFGALRDTLKFSGFGFKDITVIAATHIHPAHYGLADKLKQMSGAKVALSDIEAKFIDSRYGKTDALMKQVKQLLVSNGVPEADLTELAEASMAVRQFVGVVKPDIILKDGDKITVASSEFKVMLTPGHSPGHICLYEPKRKLFFSGDHILPDIFPHVGFHPQSGQNPLSDFFKSLETLAKLEVNFIFPGHGSVFSGFKLRLGELYYYHEQRQRAIMRIIENDTKSAYQIATEIPWMPGGESVPFNKLSTFDKRLAVMETLAQLKLLISEGKAEKVAKENVDLYWAGG
ncbi:MAG: MBL fold metallo-hydrolase [Dehalococcoidia bacterium]|nr:MBL fold metallo-hydrolase [Dehalococcoidia bacterium]